MILLLTARPRRFELSEAALGNAGARGDRALEEPGEAGVEAEPAKKRRRSASRARLTAKVLHADPLTCRTCGGKLKIVAYLHDTVAIKQILDDLGLSPPEEPKPRRPCTRSCARPSMRRAGRWTRPEDRQAAKAASSGSTTSPRKAE